ncbi:MAG: hypothetical protein U9N10_09940 [Bacillota bacterium]|nr:hypothetical protein [Bacillota bacterium]
MKNNSKITIIITIALMFFLLKIFVLKQNSNIEISEDIIQEEVLYDEKIEENLEIDNKIIGNFNQLLSLNANETELLEYIDLKENQINNNTLSILLIKFIYFQFSNLSIHDQMIQNDNIQNSLLDEYGCNCKNIDLNKLNDIQLKNRLSSLYSRGYLLNFDDGKFHLKINYNFFKKYNNKINNELSNYLEIKNNTYNPYESIKIQWEYVSDNIYLTENFLNNYKNSLLYDDIYSIYINNADYLLYGTDYINIFNEKNILNENLQFQYKKIVLNKSDIFFVNIFSSYYNELINNKFELNNNIIDKREDLFNVIKENYKN